MTCWSSLLTIWTIHFALVWNFYAFPCYMIILFYQVFLSFLCFYFPRLFSFFFSFLLCINETLCTSIFMCFIDSLLFPNVFVVWTLNTFCSVKTSGKTFAILFYCFIVATMAPQFHENKKSFVGALGILFAVWIF